MKKLTSLCVFCGASHGSNPVFRESAKHLGHVFAEQGIELVWGGGHVGLMGTVADAVLAAGGRAYGVIPEFMAGRELAHPFASEMVVVDSMHARKAAMAERADGFIAMPGGLGTLDELFEILTWAQLQIHRKPVGLLNTRGFFDPLLALLKHMAEEGFIRPHNLNLFVVSDDASALIDAMRLYVPPEGDWLDKVSPISRA